jgi:hypothetical protein
MAGQYLCPVCTGPLRTHSDVNRGRDEDGNEWPMMGCTTCLDRGEQGYFGMRADGVIVPVEPILED